MKPALDLKDWLLIALMTFGFYMLLCMPLLALQDYGFCLIPDLVYGVLFTLACWAAYHGQIAVKRQRSK